MILTMAYEHILTNEAEGILTITLNRPDKLNAFIGHMRRDLAEALEHAGSNRNGKPSGDEVAAYVEGGISEAGRGY